MDGRKEKEQGWRAVGSRDEQSDQPEETDKVRNNATGRCSPDLARCQDLPRPAKWLLPFLM